MVILNQTELPRCYRWITIPRECKRKPESPQSLNSNLYNLMNVSTGTLLQHIVMVNTDFHSLRFTTVTAEVLKYLERATLMDVGFKMYCNVIDSLPQEKTLRNVFLQHDIYGCLKTVNTPGRIHDHHLDLAHKLSNLWLPLFFWLEVGNQSAFNNLQNYVGIRVAKSGLPGK